MQTTTEKPNGIRAFQLLALKGALTLETKGIRISRSGSALATVKSLTGLTGRTAADVLPKYIVWLTAHGYLFPDAVTA